MPRREINIFTMSFLDAICCGFGAVVLLFMVINANVDMSAKNERDNLSAEARRMEIKVRTGRKNRVTMKEELAKILEEWATIRGMRDDLRTEITDTQAKFDELTEDSAARKEAIEKLRQELAAMQTENERLAATADQG